MQKVYLASYKSVHSGLHGLINRAIRLLDRSAYSHTELCVGESHPFEGEVDCYSSSGMDGGVRVKRMQLNPDRWDVQPLHTPVEWVTDLYAKTAGSKYDYFGTGRFAVPWLLREHPTRWFCSEWAAAAIGFNQAWRLSPAGLAAIFTRGT